MLVKVARSKIKALDAAFVSSPDAYAAGVRSPAIKLASRIQQIELDVEKNFYLDNWAVSAYEKFGLNDNADGFTIAELKRAYASFINSWVCLDHDNDHPSKAIGENIDAVYTPQDYVRVVKAVDRARGEARHPGLEHKIATGIITDTSMGSLVRYSVCTIPKCANMAADEDDFCKHVIPAEKGGMRGRTLCNADTNWTEVVCGELNFGSHFFEDTIITVSEGADNNAKMIELLAIKTAGRHAMTGPASISPDKLFRAIKHASRTASTEQKGYLTLLLDELLAD